MGFISRVASCNGSTLLVGFILLAAAAPTGAQPYAMPPTWGGDIESRPRLTGDWGGLRDELRKKGVVLDVDVARFPAEAIGAAH